MSSVMALPPHTLPVGNPSQVMGLRRSLAVSRAKTHLSFNFFCVTFVFWYSMAWRSVNQCARKVQNFLQNVSSDGGVEVAFQSRMYSVNHCQSLVERTWWSAEEWRHLFYWNSFPLWLSQFVQMFDQEGGWHTVFSKGEMKKAFYIWYYVSWRDPNL